MGLETVEVLFEVEDAFGIRFTDEEAVRIITVGDFEQMILEKSQGFTAEQVHAKVKEILVGLFGVNEADIVPAARIVGDLGLD